MKRRTKSSLGAVALLAAGLWVALPVLGDGGFVWKPEIDINEPSQKAIILYDAGREDLLLQVKYEGPVEGFGWLIPVPSLPKVEKGSLDPFYELSGITQRQFGVPEGRGAAEVQVIEIKTVGAYEVTVLSAQDAGSLQHWFQAQGFSVAQNKTNILDGYIRKGWYFVATRIQLNRGTSFKLTAGGAASAAANRAARQQIQAKLSSGELHPLLIRFDTPKCVYPLRISAINGQPSEVSLYLISNSPQLSKRVLLKKLEEIERQRTEWDKNQKTARVWPYQFQPLHWGTLNDYVVLRDARLQGRNTAIWSPEEIQELRRESGLLEPEKIEFNEGLCLPGRLVASVLISPRSLAKCAKDFPRLNGKAWYLTKEVWTFQTNEMQDLEFEPAVPILASIVPGPHGNLAASTLIDFGPIGLQSVMAACHSTNEAERISASSGLQRAHDARVVGLLFGLVKDPTPEVRANAVSAFDANWDPRMFEALLGLFNDPAPKVRTMAARATQNHWDERFLEPLIGLWRDEDQGVVQLCFQ